MELLLLGLSRKLFDASAASVGNSSAFALPERSTQLTWQTSFSSAPASVTIQLQVSLDNLVWSTIDTSTSTAGEARTLLVSGIFIRARINAISGGAGVAVDLVPKPVVVQNITNNYYSSGGNITASYITVNDETASLVNSRRIAAGTNITLDTTTPGIITINASGGGGGTPASPLTSVQFNDSGSFGGSADLTWSGTQLFIGTPPLNPGPGQLFVYRKSDSSGPTEQAWAMFSHTEITGSGDISQIRALDWDAIASTTGAVSAIHGNVGFAYNKSATTVGSLQAYNNFLESDTGTITEASSIDLGVGIFGGSVATLNGIWLETPDFTGGSVGDFRQIRIDDISGLTTSGVKRPIDYASKFYVDSDGSVTSPNFTVSGSAFRTDTTSGHTALFQGYNGSAYVTLATITNAATPAMDLASTVTIGGAGIVTASSTTAFTNKSGNISQWTNNSGYATATSSTAFTNKTGNISQWTNDSGYLTSVTAHNVLSATHGDTLTASVVRGDVIIGNSTPKWSRLAIGANGTVLTSNGTDVSWTAPATSGTVTSIATTSPISGGTITSTGTISLLVNVDFAFTANQSITKTVGVTSADGLILLNTTAAALGAQQWSPRIRLSGLGWSTTNSASRAVDWIIENQAVQGAANPTTNLVISSQVNAGGYTVQSTLTSAGALTIGGAITATGNLLWSSGNYGGDASFWYVKALSITTQGTFGSDCVLQRDAAAIMGFRNGTNAQNFRIYNTFTTVNTAGEWLKHDWITTANQIRIGAAKGSSTGTARVMSLDYGGTEASPSAAISIPITSGAITFGGAVQLSNAAVTGLTPGVLAASTNASIVLNDSSGQAYRIPCII